MSCENCKAGFAWNGTPTGKETTVAEIKTYVAGDNKDAAIVIVHDIYGWTFNNARLLADSLAEQAKATVYLPDFFGGEVIPVEVLSDPEKRAKFDLPSFFQRNGKQARFPEIKAVASALKSQFSKVGAIGYCYGGWAILQLAADPSLIDAVSTAHPSLVTKDELAGPKVPVQILAPEEDQMFTPELKEHANQIIPTLKIPYEYIYFPGVAHGFATRGDPNNKLQKDSLEKALRNASSFFVEHLH